MYKPTRQKHRSYRLPFYASNTPATTVSIITSISGASSASARHLDKRLHRRPVWARLALCWGNISSATKPDASIHSLEGSLCTLSVVLMSLPEAAGLPNSELIPPVEPSQLRAPRA